jgi:hypothetical protein
MRRTALDPSTATVIAGFRASADAYHPSVVISGYAGSRLAQDEWIPVNEMLHARYAAYADANHAHLPLKPGVHTVVRPPVCWQGGAGPGMR